MKAEIKKIVLDLGGKEISLSPEQAKRLYELLDEMYGEHEVVKYRDWPIYIDRWKPYWRYPEPYYTLCSSDTSSQSTWSYDKTTCEAKLTL